MIESTAVYRAAITADARRILLRAVVEIIDPDAVMGEPTGENPEPFARLDQLTDKVLASNVRYNTLEPGRWVLGHGADPVPANNVINGQVGYVSKRRCDDEGIFDPPIWVQQRFSGVTILQSCSVYFPDNEEDGHPVDFTVEIYQGGVVYHTATFSDYAEQKVTVEGFTVYNPDTIRVTVSKWSLPGRRMRTIEIVPGVYEIWDDDTVASLTITQQANFASLALPYGTCVLSMNNIDRRFEPRNKTSVFMSIEERQGIAVSLGVQLPDGSTEYKDVGVFYQADGGWKTSRNALAMEWTLMDIIGLLANRTFIPPDTLPTNLQGWVSVLVAQLGSSFAERYTVDPDYADMAVSCSTDSIAGATCGDILRWVCMATGTWPRADAETGYLTVEPYWQQGCKYTLDNLTGYPVMRANNDVATIIFSLPDGDYAITGNENAADTVTVSNPFITTQEQALTVARHILSTYGGNQIDLTGRGDPSSEIGDVDTVWLDETSATTARRMFQTFQYADGVLQACQSTLLQADGSFMFEERMVITESGEWQAPSGVGQLRIVLVSGGTGGTDGTNGSYAKAGEDGIAGAGGEIWTGTIGINEGQVFCVQVGHGGTNGQPGGITTFGDYSSGNGKVYPLGYTDIASGDSYGRTGVEKPGAGSGDGGIGGTGGCKGNKHTEFRKDYTVGGSLPDGDENNIGGVYLPVWETVIDNRPGKGTPGAVGASGCVVVYWDKE